LTLEEHKAIQAAKRAERDAAMLKAPAPKKETDSPPPKQEIDEPSRCIVADEPSKEEIETRERQVAEERAAAAAERVAAEERGKEAERKAKAEAAEKVEAERIAAEEEAEKKREAEKPEKPEEDEDAWDKDSEPVDDAEDEDEDEKKVKIKAVKEGTAIDPDPRPHVNVVFIGHVDAGKSTTCGNILYLSGYVDERTIEKYMREAKDKNRESWFLAYIMDTSDDEKAKGKTVEVGRAPFVLENKRFMILDAPGHKSYVPNMIAGASQADIAVLIISARKGEFETGFEKGGQTREHALLAKTLGVEKLIIAINKMDDNSVQWSQDRYTEIVEKLKPFLKKSGFRDEGSVTYLPISGLNGSNIKFKKDTAAWYEGPTLFDVLDHTDLSERTSEGGFRIPMLDGYRDLGTMTACGKIEQGCVKPNTKCVIVPTGKACTITKVFIQDVEVNWANVGENVTVGINGASEEDLRRGYVLCPQPDQCRAERKFKAQVQICELLEDRPVLTAGFKCVMHLHTAMEEVEITRLYDLRYMSKMKEVEQNPRYARSESILSCLITTSRLTPVDIFSGCAQLGRFTLRDEGITIAIGRVTELPKVKG